MRFRLFGRQTGLRVSELALGTGNFGTRWGHESERAEAKKVFDGYGGGNFIDTAISYQIGESEEMAGEFTGRYAMELGYHVTLVKDATAAFSKDLMHAAHALNGPNFAHAILTTNELMDALHK
jgi:predicted aldo/keto reductase-like oxidoreductase